MALELPDISSVNLKRPDKITFWIMLGVLGLLAAGVGYGFYLLLPTLLELATNTIVFFAELGVLAFMLILALQVFLSRQAIFYKMQMFARNVRKAVVKSDPIGVIDVAIHRFEQRLEDVDERMKESQAAINNLDIKIRNTRKTGVLDMAENEESLAVTAQRQNRAEADVNLHLVAAEQWRRAAGTLEPLLAGQRARQIKIQEARGMCDRSLTSLKTQKQTLSIQLDALRADAAQAKAFRRFFGNNEDLDMIDMAVDEIERQSAACEAEVTQMLQQADPIIQKEALQRDADAQKARARLAAAMPPDVMTTTSAPVATVIPIDRRKQ